MFSFLRVACSWPTLCHEWLVCKKVYKTLIRVGMEKNRVWNIWSPQKTIRYINFPPLFLLIVMLYLLKPWKCSSCCVSVGESTSLKFISVPCRRFLQQFCKQMNTTATLPHTPALLYNPNYRGNLKRNMLSDDLPL